MKKPRQTQKLTFFTFSFSDLSSPVSLTEKKSVTGLETVWGIDLKVLSKVKSAVFSTSQEKKYLSARNLFLSVSTQQADKI